MREEVISTIKDIILTNIWYVDGGCFFCRGTDESYPLNTIYEDKENGIKIDVCWAAEYLEIFGLTKDEEDDIDFYYCALRGIIIGLKRLAWHSGFNIGSTLKIKGPEFEITINKENYYEKM